MQSLRRAAARAACSSSMAAVAIPRQQIVSLSMRVGKAHLQPAAIVQPLTRYFSQTSRMAEDEERVDLNETKPIEGDEAGRSKSPEENTVFVSNIAFDATEAHLKEAFSNYGTVLSMNLVRDGRGLSRGFGFVTFETRESCDRAVKEADESFWRGRRITVRFRKAPEGAGGIMNRPREPTKSLYIGNIPYETSDAELNNLFKELDNVVDVRVAVDRNTGWPRGFAHADFTDVESAEKALEKLSNVQLTGRYVRVDYAQESKRNPFRPRSSSSSQDS